jgi:diguanylate cyclase (GGDEF)-like protein/PAS domain S-box-containing protein
MLLIIFVSSQYSKKSIIFATIFAIFILGVQDLYTLDINILEYIIEIFMIIIAASYIYKSTSSRDKINHELKERVKELSSLYNISKIKEIEYGSLKAILEKVVDEIPSGYQYPEDTSALIRYDNYEFKSSNFKETKWFQKAEIKINNEVTGSVEVYYLHSHPEEFEGTLFLKEERDLIELFARRISNIIKAFNQENKLREQRRFLAVTLNSIGDGVIVTDKEGKIRKINKVAQNLTKWSLEDAKDKYITEVFKIINSKTRKTVDNPVAKVLEKGKIVGLANHTKLIAKDETEYHIADSASPIKDEAGNIYGVVLVFRNVTKEYSLRNEIINKAQIFSNAVEVAPFPIMLYNNKGKVLDINEVWQEITGYTKEEIPTIEDWTEKAYGVNKDSVREFINDLDNIDGRNDDGEFIIKTKDDDYRTWDFKTSKIGIDEDGNNMFISMAIDVTERNLMEKKIMILNRIYKTLSSINQVIVKENTLEDLINESTQIAVEIGEYNTAWIAKLSADKNELDILSFSGRRCMLLEQKEKISLNLKSDDLNIYEKAILENEDQMVNIDRGFELKGEHCGSSAVFIIKAFDKTWGVMGFCSDKENRFNEKEIDLLKELSTDISLGIEKIINNNLRIKSEKMLKKSEKEYRQLVQKSPIGIYKTTYSGKLLFVNPTIAKLLGFDTPEEVYEHYDSELKNKLYVDPEKREEFLNQLERFGEIRGYVYRIYDKNNEIKWVEDNARINSEKLLDDFIVEGFVTDITERKKHQEKINYMSLHDNLTGLYNRNYIEDMMKRIDIQRNLPISIIMADLNNLKLVNDSYGHTKGDELIVKAAEIIKNSFRKDDVVARWGGDEFVILLPETSLKKSEKLIERINKKKIGEDLDISISIAIGTASKTSINEDIFKVLNLAEDRMYINKLANRESARSVVISSFLNTLKEKSFETEAHVNRMSKMAKKFGKRLELSKENIDKLLMLSLLHDIGKISVPEKILNKTGSLTEEEWQIVKAHPEAGYRILESIPRFSLIAEAALHHHERWDGSGYPNGLKGVEIPLLSRILSIVDSYDVMVSGRPYKEAMDKEEVIEEFKSCAGSQFDPELVKVFINILNNE